jgi:hypothetical protein
MNGFFDEGPTQARLEEGVTGLVIDDYGNCT